MIGRERGGGGGGAFLSGRVSLEQEVCARWGYCCSQDKRRRGGGYSCVACLSHLTIDHAFLRDRAPFLFFIETPPTFGRSFRCFHVLHKMVCLSYPLTVLPSVATIYLLGRRSLSRYSLVYQTLLCHIGLLCSSPLLTHPVPPCIFHIILQCDSYSLSYCCATRAHMRIRVLLPSYWHISSCW